MKQYVPERPIPRDPRWRFDNGAELGSRDDIRIPDTMSLIAEYTLSNPILREARRAVPAVELKIEDEQLCSGEQPRLIFWAAGDESDLEAFLIEARDDPSVTDFEILSKISGNCLFRVTPSPDAQRGVTYPDAIESDITFLEITAQGASVTYRALVPERDALFEYRKRCEERDLSFELRRLYRSETLDTDGYGLTDRQREVLRRALERGYFEVPRAVSTRELAEEFGISSQALSALLRRGQSTLVKNTIG